MTALLVLFAWSFLAATVVPVGSEPMLIGLVRSGAAIPLAVAVATAGNFLGACTLFWMGRKASHWVERRAGRSATGARATFLLGRYGRPALALSWVPLLGDALVGLAGVAGISFAAFTGWVLAGKAARYLAVAWIAVRLL